MNSLNWTTPHTITETAIASTTEHMKVADTSYIVIPLMSFVFGFPFFVIVLLCVIQQRNKCLQRRYAERLRQQRKFSCASSMCTTNVATSGRKESMAPSLIGRSRAYTSDAATQSPRQSQVQRAAYVRPSPYSHRDSVQLTIERKKCKGASAEAIPNTADNNSALTANLGSDLCKSASADNVVKSLAGSIA